jgi:MoxR-like ATPase
MILSDDVKALIADLTSDFRNTPPAAEERVLATLFEPIVGFNDVKELLRRAVHAAKPVHVLLEVPPASAKTLFLMELGRLPEAHFVVGGTASRAGLAELLVMWRPRYLLVDEIETIDNAKDYAALLHLMENQEVIETKFRRHARMPLTTWVFAAGNDVSKLPPALLSRFGGPKGVIRFREYTSAEFLDVATAVLAMREDVPQDFARKIATATIDLGSKDVRLAVRLGRMAKDEATLARVAETMRRRR